MTMINKTFHVVVIPVLLVLALALAAFAQAPASAPAPTSRRCAASSRSTPRPLQYAGAGAGPVESRFEPVFGSGGAPSRFWRISLPVVRSRSRAAGSVTVPGLITRTTSRRTSPLALLASST